MWDGAPLSHDLPCPFCFHTAHHFLACADDCACDHAEVLGIDTALGG